MMDYHDWDSDTEPSVMRPSPGPALEDNEPSDSEDENIEEDINDHNIDEEVLEDDNLEDEIDEDEIDEDESIGYENFNENTDAMDLDEQVSHEAGIEENSMDEEDMNQGSVGRVGIDMEGLERETSEEDTSHDEELGEKDIDHPPVKRSEQPCISFPVLDMKKLRHSFSGRRQELPEVLYRVQSEKSGTLSMFVPDYDRPTHAPKLKPGNALQSYGNHTYRRKITRKQFERHHKIRKFSDPSISISLSDNFDSADWRCKNIWGKKSQQAGRRITVSVFTTKGLIPAVYETDEIDEDTGLYIRIPIWIRDIARPPDGSPITLAQLEESGADVYLSVLEQRCAGWNVTGDDKHGQWHEWMALGFVPEMYVLRVMPFDGEKIHQTPQRVVCKADLNFYFDPNKRRWCHISEDHEPSNIDITARELADVMASGFFDLLQQTKKPSRLTMEDLTTHISNSLANAGVNGFTHRE